MSEYPKVIEGVERVVIEKPYRLKIYTDDETVYIVEADIDPDAVSCDHIDCLLEYTYLRIEKKKGVWLLPRG